MGQIEDGLAAKGIEIPPAATPAGAYVPVVQTGNLLFVSGQIPATPDGVKYVGRLGEHISLEEGQDCARLCALNIVAQVKAFIGDLDNVNRVVKLTGFVNSTPDFPQQPQVVHGASNRMAEIFGDAGKHSRAAVGVSVLPLGVAVEVEAVIEVTS